MFVIGVICCNYNNKRTCTISVHKMMRGDWNVSTWQAASYPDPDGFDGKCLSLKQNKKGIVSWELGNLARFWELGYLHGVDTFSGNILVCCHKMKLWANPLIKSGLMWLSFSLCLNFPHEEDVQLTHAIVLFILFSPISNGHVVP